jgi:DNA-binding NarL/FixJ family response regulator
MKIAIIEDSEDVRTSLKKLLSSIGGVVIGETDSVSGGTEIINLNPDIIILDIKLTDGSSFQLLKKIKSLLNPPIVIIFTSYSAKPYVDVAMKEKADYFFNKQEDLQKLVDTLENLINNETSLTRIKG